MKSLIKISAFILLAISVFCFTGCTLAKDINDSVKLPEQYGIAYEIENADGTVHVVKKVQDAEGNVYFKSGSTELLFIKGERYYSLYEKDENGVFVTSNAADGYSLTYVDEATAEFSECAEYSKKRFIPGVSSDGETTMLGRDCLIYTIKVGFDANGVTYTLFTDKETGVCLAWQEKGTVGGHEIAPSGLSFECVEFVVGNVASLKELINE